MIDITHFLSCLDMVRLGKKNQWMARCPAHDDRSPSLSIGLAEDGRILLHCFAGCAATDITAAVGISASELFPKCEQHHIDQLPEWKKRRFEEQLSMERLIIEMFRNMVKNKEDISPKDQNRFKEALRRIRKLEGALYG